MMARLWLAALTLLWLTACGPTGSLTGDEASSDSDTDSATKDDSSQTTEVVQVDVSGRITYEDRMYDDTGFITGNTPDKAARRVVVDLLDADNNAVGTTLTDHTGHYAFTQIPIGDYSLRVLARATADSGETLSVYNLSDTLYAVSQAASFSEEQTSADVSIPLSSRMAGPFNMLDVALSGTEFFHHYSDTTATLNDLNLYWQYGQSSGSYTCIGTGGGCSEGSGIYVLSDPYSTGDTDEFDDDVLWHEFAHHIEFSTGMTDSPGGYHSLVDTDLDLRLSWSEGMANYFQTAVKAWLRSTHPERLSIPGHLDTTRYTDTRSSTVNVSIDLANLPTQFSYATNEAAIAMSLIGLQDRAGQARVWAPLVDELPANTYADTLEAYWDGLLQSQPTNQELAEWRAVLSERAIQYQRDGLETDHLFADAPSRDCTFTDQTLPANCVIGERHTLYHASGQADSDTLALSVTAGVRYRIWTHDLRNGADTRIGLYHADGTALVDGNGDPLINDDTVDCETQAGGCSPLHDGSHFASALEFVAAEDATLYLVTDTADAAWSDPANYGYLGRYGDYAVTIRLLESGATP